jgi:hypothetical protein
MEKEKEILKLLGEVWNQFLNLQSQHPDELEDFKEGIHKCQYVIGMRFAREYNSDIFPKK